MGSLLYETIVEWLSILLYFLTIIGIGFFIKGLFGMLHTQLVDDLMYQLHSFIQNHMLIVLFVLGVMAYLSIRRVRKMRKYRLKHRDQFEEQTQFNDEYYYNTDRTASIYDNKHS